VNLFASVFGKADVK